jgi:hypothetical protein
MRESEEELMVSRFCETTITELEISYVETTRQPIN